MPLQNFRDPYIIPVHHPRTYPRTCRIQEKTLPTPCRLILLEFVPNIRKQFLFRQNPVLLFGQFYKQFCVGTFHWVREIGIENFEGLFFLQKMSKTRDVHLIFRSYRVSRPAH